MEKKKTCGSIPRDLGVIISIIIVTTVAILIATIIITITIVAIIDIVVAVIIITSEQTHRVDM